MCAQSLGLIALVVPDYDAGIAFYRDIMGFELISDEDQGAGKRWVVVRPKGAQTGLLLARAVTDPQRAAIGNQTGGRVGFFLHSTRFDADYAAYKTAGVLFEETPRPEPYGKVAVFQDPFGNRWDLLEAPEA